MKKTIVAIAAVLTASIMAASYDASAQVKLGPKAGIAASWLPGTNLNGDVLTDFKDKVLPHNSFYAGVSAEYEFVDSFIGQVEVLYVGKGHSDRTVSLTLDTWSEKYNLELGYVQVPVFVGYRFLDDQISIMAGPEFGFNVLAKAKTTFNKDILPADPVSANVKDAIRPFNIGLGLQVSYDFLDGLGLDAKVSWGLNRTFHDGKNSSQNIAPGTIDRGHNMTIQLGLFYKFEI